VLYTTNSIESLNCELQLFRSERLLSAGGGSLRTAGVKARKGVKGGGSGPGRCLVTVKLAGSAPGTVGGVGDGDAQGLVGDQEGPDFLIGAVGGAGAMPRMIRMIRAELIGLDQYEITEFGLDDVGDAVPDAVGSARST
jgi:hypothetical protein